jgi:hypothetical protein
MSKYLTVEQAIQLFEQMERSRSGQAQTVVKGLLSAASKSAINGQLTGGDLIVNIGIMGSFTGAGILITSVSVISGETWGECSHYIVSLTKGGAFLSLTRTAIDALDLYTLFGETIGQFLNWIDDKRKQRPEKEIVQKPLVINRAAESKPKKLFLLPNGQEIPISTLRYVLESMVEKGGLFWSREYWCHKPDNPERPGVGFLKTRQWAGIKQLCYEYSEDTEEALAWRTNDRHAVYEMLDYLLEEETLPPAPADPVLE